MRASTLSVSSIALVAAAAVAVVDARAQDAPVVYRTDPGEAHPRYAPPPPEAANPAPMHVVSTPQVVGQAAPAIAARANVRNPQAYEVSASYGRDPVYGVTQRGTISVGPGDTVYGIARRYGIPPADIIAINRLQSPYKLSIGQILALPDSGVLTSPTMAIPAAMAGRASPAPVPTAERYYRVRPGDTLFSLSRTFGVDVASLANTNRLYAPYHLAIDQTLIIPGGGTFIAGAAAPTPLPLPSLPSAPTLEEQDRLSVQPILVSKNPGARFAWPIRGAVLKEFGVTATGDRHDGIKIAAPIGAPIRAVDDGEVVYTGADLEGYGNLLLVRHDGGWVSAYGHTDHILVRKGDRVRQGQVVAKVGRSGDVDQPQLHFELRHDLQPRDPMLALTGQDMLARASFQ